MLFITNKIRNRTFFFLIDGEGNNSLKNMPKPLTTTPHIISSSWWSSPDFSSEVQPFTLLDSREGWQTLNAHVIGRGHTMWQSVSHCITVVDELPACNRHMVSCIPACFCVTWGSGSTALLRHPTLLISHFCRVLSTPGLPVFTSLDPRERSGVAYRRNQSPRSYCSWYKDTRKESLMGKAVIPSTQAALAQRHTLRKSGLIKLPGMPSWSFRTSLKRPEYLHKNSAKTLQHSEGCVQDDMQMDHRQGLFEYAYEY